MTVSKVQNGTSLTIRLSGRLDTTTSPQLVAELEGAFDGCSELVFDMADLDYISSAGLRILLNSNKKITKNGGVMTIRNSISVNPDGVFLTEYARFF